MDLLRRVALLAILSGCVPDLDVDESQLGAPRLLAVRAEPAEVVPGEPARFVALYADAAGALDAAPIDWALCVVRRPLAELGPVAAACLETEGEGLVPLGAGVEAGATIPRDACRLFGPEPPPALAGEPAGRAVDPDVTGGYAIPLRLRVHEDDDAASLAIFEARLACGLFGATQQESAAYTQRYRRNFAPTVEALELVREDGAVLALEPDVATPVAPGERVTLRVAWPSCPDVDVCGDGLCGIDETRASCAEDCGAAAVGCGGQERFLRFDLAARALVADREAMRAAWYTSQGTLDVERTGASADEAARTMENALTLPDDREGAVTVLVVLRDARGGVSWREAHLQLER